MDKVVDNKEKRGGERHTELDNKNTIQPLMKNSHTMSVYLPQEK
jgi:hypothetical protein